MLGSMTIKCVECGKDIVLDRAAYRNYTGVIRCAECKALLEITTSSGQLQRSPVVRERGSKEK